MIVTRALPADCDLLRLHRHGRLAFLGDLDLRVVDTLRDFDTEAVVADLGGLGPVDARCAVHLHVDLFV